MMQVWSQYESFMNTEWINYEYISMYDCLFVGVCRSINEFQEFLDQTSPITSSTRQGYN